MTPLKHQGVSLIEILVASVVVTMAFLPILTMVQSETRQASFNESRLLARARARRATNAYAVHGFEKLLEIVGNPMPGPDRHQLPQILDEPGAELTTLSSKLAHPESIDRLTTLMTSLTTSSWLEYVEPGLIRISTSISFDTSQSGGLPPGPDVIKSVLVSRPDASLMYRRTFAFE